MPDMIPAARIAEIAFRHIREAEAKVDEAVYSTEARAAVKRSMAAATELMALIVPAPPLASGGLVSGVGILVGDVDRSPPPLTDL